MNDRRWVRYQLDSGERISRKMQLDLVDKLIEINRKLNEVKRGRALLPDRKHWGLRDVGVYAGNLKYYEVLKRKWKVSMSAMIMRSKNLGLIDYDKYQMMMRRMQKLGIRKTEPLDDVLITAQPSILKTAVEMLINGNVLTAREFMMELSNDYGISLYPYDVEELLDLKKGTLNISDNIIPIHDLNLKKGD